MLFLTVVLPFLIDLFSFRVHTFGVGENVSKRLVKGMARAGRGRSEFIAIKDRMQSKVSKAIAVRRCL